MSLVSLAFPFYYNPNPARVKRNEERKKNEGMKERRLFRPRRGRLGHRPRRGGRQAHPRFPCGGSGRRPMGASVPPFLLLFTANLCGGISRASASRLWLPRPSADRGRRSPAATRPRSFAAFAAVPDPLNFPCFSHSFPPLQPMRALENRCKLCHNINYENVGSRGCGSGF